MAFYRHSATSLLALIWIGVILLSMDKFVTRIPLIQNNRRSLRRLKLSLSYGVTSESIGIDRSYEIDYKYLNNQDELQHNRTDKEFINGYPRKKGACLELIGKVFGKECILVGGASLFGRDDGGKSKCFMRCNVCVEYPTHVLAAANLNDTNGTIASFKGRTYKLCKLIYHVTAGPHFSAVKQYQSIKLIDHLQKNPDINPNDATDNVLITQVTDIKKDIYYQRVRHCCIVYNDMKCITTSFYSFPSRDIVESYALHCIKLRDKPKHRTTIQ